MWVVASDGVCTPATGPPDLPVEDYHDEANTAAWLSLERQRLTAELADAIAARDAARVDAAALQALFDLQWTRMGEATAMWRAEKPDERALIMPDLGDLLAWLMARAQPAATDPGGGRP